MTVRSHPWIKLLFAIITAIAVGIILGSWSWGIATFFIAMFIFIFVAYWIFGGEIKGKVAVTYELEELLGNMAAIGETKNELPLSSRGWCNSLGLFVQIGEKGGLTRLEAGDDKYYSKIDAWRDSSFEWKVMKYVPGDWEKLVTPTCDIVSWLHEHGGLPEEYAHSFYEAIEVYKKQELLILPDIKKAGETRKDKIAGSIPEDEVGVKKLSNITKAITKIDDPMGFCRYQFT